MFRTLACDHAENRSEWPLLNSASLPQLRREAGAERRQVRVAADVLLVDKDVGNGALARKLLEGVLDDAAVACCVSEDRYLLAFAFSLGLLFVCLALPSTCPQG